LTGVGTVTSLAFIVAANWLPWATSNLGSVRHTPGALTPFMTGVGAIVIVVSLATLRRPSRLADIVLMWLSVLAMVIAVIVALDSISSANADPGGGTAYGAGSGVGVVAALVMVLVAAARFAVEDNDKQVRPAEHYYP
jgi:hypothetical protein